MTSKAETDLLERLRATMRVAQQGRFYQSKFSHLSLNEVRTLKQFVDLVPLTTKTELLTDQAQNPPYGSSLTLPLTAYPWFHQTSGSQGKPWRKLSTQKDMMRMISNYALMLKTYKVSVSDRCFFAFSFAPFLGCWVAFEAARSLNCLCISGASMRSAQRLEEMIQNRCTVLFCNPTYAFYLTQLAKKKHVTVDDLPLKLIILSGEPGAQSRSHLQELKAIWTDAMIYDHYGMTELGPISYQCPVDRKYAHIFNDTFFIELIDSTTLRPISNDAEGELVITSITDLDQPLIRYRTGDVAVLSKHFCHCNHQGVSIVHGIKGRTDDMLTIRGVNVYPSTVDAIVREFSAIDEYQVDIFQNNGILEIKLSIQFYEGQQTVAIVDALSQKIRETIGLRISVITLNPGTLALHEFKAKRWFFRVPCLN